MLHILLWIAVLLINLVLRMRGLSRGVNVAGRWRQTIGTQYTLHALLVLLEERGQSSLLTLLLDGDQLLLPSLSNLQDIILGSCLTPNRKKADCIGLGHSAQLRIAPSHVALPVRVVGDISGRNGDRIIIG